MNIMLLTLLNDRYCWRDYLNQNKITDYKIYQKYWIRKQKLKKIL